MTARKPNATEEAMREALDRLLEEAKAKPFATAGGKMCVRVVPSIPEKGEEP